MNILVLNGSPRRNGNTKYLIDAFKAGAQSRGHTVQVEDVAHQNIRGCMGCEYCHTQGKGTCVQKDDMQRLYQQILSADMLVFASPIYYFTLSAQLQSVIHRTYAIGVPQNIKKTALILSSGSAYVYGPAIAQYYQSIVEYWKVENAGIFTANGADNRSKEKWDELYLFGKSLSERGCRS